jgi:hypothetical protein
MALKLPSFWRPWFEAYKGQRKQVTFTLRTTSKILETWERGVTPQYSTETRECTLYYSGDTIIWLNNLSRKVDVQMMVRDAGHDTYPVVFDTVTIKVGECYVLENPTIASNVTGQSRGRRNSGNQS